MTNNDVPQTTQPLRELSIRRERFMGGYSDLKVRISDEGNLVLDGANGSPSVKALHGDWDVEFSETVLAEWKDTTLLHLVKDRFTSTSQFRSWCEARGIPHKFWSWT